MGLVQKILHFLGGKPPKVQYRDRELFHEHPEKKWDDWKNRFKDSDYKWEEHTGKTWQPRKSDKPKA